MKKKSIISIISAAVLILSLLAVAGCGATSLGRIDMKEVQDTSYAVHSNGGNLVQYGNYVYFINGYAGYEDTEGTANEWNKVVKGALYRAELAGEKGDKVGDKYEFNVKGKVSEVSDEYLEFVFSKGEDYDENEIDVVDVQLVAPKVIGTSGYGMGGVYFYDNYVYYASPNNERNKAGVVQYKKTDFFRTSLDGKITQRLFTTESDSADSPYAFYKQKGKTYLVVLDGTTLKSVVMNDNKVEDTLQLAENVTSAYLPSRSDYYGEEAQGYGAEDFVYICRSATDDDKVKSGNILEFMAPDGEGRTVFWADTGSASLEAVRDGVVFFRYTKNNNTAIRFSNLHDLFMENSEEYKAYEDKQTVKRTTVSGDALNINNISAFSYTYAFRPSASQDVNTNMTYVFASTGSEAYLFGSDGTSKLINKVSATVKNVADGYAYYLDSDKNLCRYSIFTENAEVQVVSDRAVTESGLNVDVAAGYVLYFGEIDDWADDYALFYKLPGEGLEGAKAVFVGQRNEDDVKPEEDE